MGYGVFIHRTDSIYDDVPSEEYQFPRQYLARARACAGDWIIYYEPVKTKGSKGYYAMARVQQIIPDPAVADMYLALIEAGSYLSFSNPVPFVDVDGPVERDLAGRGQWSVRPLSAADFRRIADRGLSAEELLPRLDAAPGSGGMADEAAPFVFEEERERASFLMSRIVRDRVFRQVVLRAYDSRCAVTGLKLINGGGRAEVEAAHIRPVEEGGPDIVSNGIALSGTAHWMFDRGLIGLGDDLTVLISRKVNDVESVRTLLNKDGRARPPVRPGDHPHPLFLKWHRQRHGFEGEFGRLGL